MSVVLPFPRNPVSKRAQGEILDSAEILIFPGVHVERRSFELATALTPARKRRVSQAALEEAALGLT
jgi:hypothetical protein